MRSSDLGHERGGELRQRPALGEGLLTAEGAHWRWQRRGVAPAFAGVGHGMQRAYEAAGMASVTLPDGRAMALSGDQDPQKVLRLLAAGGAGD